MYVGSEKMKPDQLRAAFCRFAGTERARRFVLQLRSDAPLEGRLPYPDGRGLRFWQVELWNDFAENSKGIPTDIDAIRTAMLWCDIHNRVLEEGAGITDPSDVTGKDGRLNDDFMKALDSDFPFGFGFWTLVCPDCVVRCDKWINGHVRDG